MNTLLLAKLIKGQPPILTYELVYHLKLLHLKYQNTYCNISPKTFKPFFLTKLNISFQ